MVSRRARRIAAAVFLCGTVGLIAGCGKKEGAPKAATQVAAKVNSAEITVHQVNAVLSRSPNVPAEAAPRAKREVLTRLIDQRLAVEQAIAKKLDRSPDIVQAIELARAEILARAYADSVARAQPKPTDEDVKKYYDDHPELFARRRVYSLEEIAVASKDDIGPELNDMAARRPNMAEIGKWLQGKGVRIAPNHGTRAAEQIPMALLTKIQDAKDGEIRVIQTPTGFTVVRVLASRSAPVPLAAAEGRIRQFLFNQRAAEAVAADMKALKAAAKIEYQGEFAEDLGVAEAKAKEAAAAKAKALADAKAQAEAEALERAEAARKARQASEARAKEAGPGTKATAAKGGELKEDTLKKGLGGLR